VNAVLIAEVPSDEQPLLYAGLQIEGRVSGVAGHRGKTPASLLILFDRIVRPGAVPVPLAAKVIEVDNARESVSADGTIRGLVPIRIQPSKTEDVLMAAAYAHPLLLGGMEGMRLLRKKMENPEIHYPPGVEMRLELTAPLDADALGRPVLTSSGTLISPALFADLVSRQPLHTYAAGRASDQTNLLFVGSDTDLDSAFTAAGWSRAAQGVRNDLRTLVAMFDEHGYKVAPVSTLTLEGQSPDRVYEKQTDTFSKRHHVRIWRRPGSFRQMPVWLAAASHDIGIRYSHETRHITHRVESNVDLERKKILDDLRFTGFVKTFAYVPRASAPREFRNATGDDLITDGRIVAVVIEKSSP
jgi:hypothetical protein